MPWSNLPDIEVCGKTGTAQNKGKDHSIFMGFAPMNKPKIAIAVYVENAGFGATWAVPIASVLMEKYLKGTLSPERMKTVDEISNTNLIQYGFKEY
ncbi:penicillin-binding protein [Bacteroides graminisolvens DSM 19988 = JCM 15093]|uniref:Penicillin-binding protein n=1 Tax=Bacteroides graminisolvens DSM 19988 = JCM 15093 TaxID=1121097 RepID=A0A069DBL5_9BACE|nr:penicillin-binding protein [Bacteroides graminisolvens DSM 19988 = JCM 15093]